MTSKPYTQRERFFTTNGGDTFIPVHRGTSAPKAYTEIWRDNGKWRAARRQTRNGQSPEKDICRIGPIRDRTKLIRYMKLCRWLDSSEEVVCSTPLDQEAFIYPPRKSLQARR